MVGLLIVTHSNLAQELLAAAEMIIGPVQGCEALAIRREDSLETIEESLSKALDKVASAGSGAIILTDMIGGTPANISLNHLQPDKVEVLTGANLPMVLKFFNSRGNMSAGELAGVLKAYGQQSILLASELLAKN